MIDWNRVDELRSDIGAEDFAEVIEIFLEEVEETMATLDSHAGSDGLTEALHFLKGSALNIGFRQLAELCDQGERHAAEGRHDEVPLVEIRRSYAASRSVFLAEGTARSGGPRVAAGLTDR